MPPRSLEEALEDPDTRVFALQDKGFDYAEVPSTQRAEELKPDQKENLRFFTNPVQRLDSEPLKDGVKYFGGPESDTDQLFENVPEETEPSEDD